MFEYERTRKFTLLNKKETEIENSQDVRQSEAITQVEAERKHKQELTYLNFRTKVPGQNWASKKGLDKTQTTEYRRN